VLNLHVSGLPSFLDFTRKKMLHVKTQNGFVHRRRSCSFPEIGDSPLNHIVLTFVSVALLLSVVTLIKERRLRMALQQILTRLLIRWRSHANTQVPEKPDRRDADAGGDRV
jgi:hypothetical protein